MKSISATYEQNNKIVWRLSLLARMMRKHTQRTMRKKYQAFHQKKLLFAHKSYDRFSVNSYQYSPKRNSQIKAYSSSFLMKSPKEKNQTFVCFVLYDMWLWMICINHALLFLPDKKLKYHVIIIIYESVIKYNNTDMHGVTHSRFIHYVHIYY